MSLVRSAGLTLIGLFCVSWSHAAPRQLPGRAEPAGKIMPILDQANPVYHVMRAQTATVIDGRADDWKDVPAMVLDQKEQSGGNWTGPKDLSGSLRIVWDDKALYFCLQVTDDVHHAPNAAHDFWENDGSQFAFEPYLCGPRGTYHADTHSYAVGDSPAGPVLVAYRLPGLGQGKETPLTDRVVKMGVGAGGVRVFEWAMTWDQLAPVSPWILGRCGFGWTLNDNDGKGFKGSMAWGKGILYGQDASKLGQLVFDGAVGVQPALLGLCPEVKGRSEGATSRWLDTPGTTPFGNARLLVRVPKTTSVEAIVNVYQPGGKDPIAAGTIKRDVAPGQTVVFSWDTSSLPDGRYELTYSAPAIKTEPGPRRAYFQLNTDRLRARYGELRARFGTDRPWDTLSTAPPVVQRHRGMIAAMLNILEEDSWAAAMIDTDPYDQHLMMLAHLATMVEALDAGKDFLAGERGVFWSAYYSPADASGQFFVMILPADFNPAKTYPLFVNVHGYGEVPGPYRVKQNAAFPGIEVQPWGRGNSGYLGLGEIDVLQVIEYVKRWYQIDSSRVYLSGPSMGGSGTWRLASLHPDLFAAAAPIYGGNDGLPLENLRNVPILNQHGDQDWVVPIDSSRYGVSRLQQLGYPVLHNEIPGAGHGTSQLYPVRDWCRAFGRPDRPGAVTWTCQTPENGRAYWLTVLEFVEPHDVVQASAQVAGNGDQQSVTLSAANAAAVALDITAMPVDRQSALLVQAGYDFLQVKAPLPEKLFMVQNNGRWSVAEKWAPPESQVRAYRPGAVANLYCSNEPLMIVYGTQGSPERVQLLRRAAEWLARWPGARDPMPAGRFPVKADKDVTADDLARWNLILIGSPKDSDLAARILAKLPLQINEKNQLIAGDREPVSLDGAGLRLLADNPLAPQRLVFWIVPSDRPEDTGEVQKWLNDPGELMTGGHGFNRGSQADLIVQDLADGAMRSGRQFTSGWQWRALPGAERRAPAITARAREFTQAKLRCLCRSTGADYALDWGSPETERRYDPATFTVADLRATTPGSQTLLGTVSGPELIGIHQHWLANHDLEMFPAVDPKAIETNRLYRLAMPPSVCYKLKRRERNLQNAEAGPEVPASAIVAGVLEP